MIPPQVLASLISLGGTALGVGANISGAKRQESANLRLAKYQFDRNQELLNQQLEYNTPANQMKRFKEAGLNPNMIYGQGSPGNQSAPLSYPELKAGDYQSAYRAIPQQVADLVLKTQQAKLMESQRDLTDNKVLESTVKRQLMSAQKDLVKANPLMKSEYVDAMVRNLVSVANIKEQESNFMLQRDYYKDGDQVLYEPRGVRKMEIELKNLENKFNLQSLDQKMKAELIQGKGFQNALQEIQLRWMKDAEITPQHIYLFLQMLMSKMM